MICDATMQDRAPRHELVQRQQVAERLVVVRIGQPPREADHAQDVHREERAVEEDERQEEVHLAPVLVHHPAEHLGEPEVDRPEHAHRRAGEQHVVEVGDDEVRVVNEDVDRRGGHEDARQAADDEHRHERQGEQHRRGELNLAAPDRAQPVEHLDRAGQRDHHRRDHERHAQHRVHARDEHVMAPHDEAQPGDAGDRVDHRLVAEQRLAGEAGDDVARPCPSPAGS